MAEYFRNAQDFTSNNPNFSQVGRDQYNFISNAQPKSRLWIQGTEEEEAEFEQYREVIRGDVELIRSVASNIIPFDVNTSRQLECEKEISVGHILDGIESGQGPNRTVISYKGREAREAWMEDFKRCTGFLSADNAHLLAINRSKIPLLIFAKVLAPAGQFIRGMDPLGQVYIYTMSIQLGCNVPELWMDTQRGVLCRGPPGPPSILNYYGLEGTKNLPIQSTVEFLQGDVFFRFLAGVKSEDIDRDVLGALSDPFLKGYYVSLDQRYRAGTWTIDQTRGSWRVNHSIGKLRSLDVNDNNAYQTWDVGTARFTLENSQTSISIWWNDSKSKEIWLSQAWSVFDAIGVSLDDDLDEYRFHAAVLHLEGNLSQSTSECRLRRQQPIYLFVNSKESYFWSLDADGRSSLTTDMCCQLGLPVVLEEKIYNMVHTWRNETYRTIRQYQIDRGFDPTTTDFTRSLGYPVYRIVSDDPAQSEEFEEPKEGGEEDDEQEQEEEEEGDEDEQGYEQEGEEYEEENEDEEVYEKVYEEVYEKVYEKVYEEEYEEEGEEEGEEEEEQEDQGEEDEPPKESMSILTSQTNTWTLYRPFQRSDHRYKYIRFMYEREASV